jgi:hypothetical protein
MAKLWGLTRYATRSAPPAAGAADADPSPAIGVGSPSPLERRAAAAPREGILIFVLRPFCMVIPPPPAPAPDSYLNLEDGGLGTPHEHPNRMQQNAST